MNFPAMMLYWGDYLRDTGHLSTEQHGALLLLLAHAWTHDGVLPLDDEALRRITRMDPKPWGKSRAVIVAFFYRAEDGYRQKRVEKELAKARATVARNHEQRDGTAERTRRWRERQNGNPPATKPNGQAPPGDAHVTRHRPVTDAVTQSVTTPSRDAYPLPEPQPYPVPIERKKVNKIPFLGEETSARGSREQNSVPDQLAELLAEEGIEPPNPEPEEVPNVIDILDARDAARAELGQTGAVGAQIRRAAKALAMRIPYAEVRSVDAQLAALQEQPQVVGADATMGLRWAPAEPVRSVEEQRTALLAGCTPDQIARAQRYAARYAS